MAHVEKVIFRGFNEFVQLSNRYEVYLKNFI